MPKFTKISKTIEAEQFFTDSRTGLPFADKRACKLGPDGWYVTTIHGQETRIVDGDWIIPEPDGEHFYPCKPDIFAQTYEPVSDGSLKLSLGPPVFDYTKRERFAVVRKLPKNQRYGSNFLRLYEDRCDAEEEALRLARKVGEKFYIIEIQRIATPGAVQVEEVAANA